MHGGESKEWKLEWYQSELYFKPDIYFSFSKFMIFFYLRCQQLIKSFSAHFSSFFFLGIFKVCNVKEILQVHKSLDFQSLQFLKMFYV